MRLKNEFGYDIDGDDVAECWGIAANAHGDCKVKDGRFEGSTLSELWRDHPELFGHVGKGEFPLLVKILDAREDLSIQVHPDDSYAKLHGLSGKSECWYILDCPDDATIIAGHHAKNRDELRKMVAAGRWDELLCEIPIRKGDLIPVDPGMLHAIKAGTLLLEIQQNSDTTFRVYDYDRCGKDSGRKRELHIEQGLDVIRVPDDHVEQRILHTEDYSSDVVPVYSGTPHAPANQSCELFSNEFFRVYKLDVSGEMTRRMDRPFLLLSVIEGDGSIDGRPIRRGDHFILTHAYGDFCLQGRMQIIASGIA